jgi:hypothetical protein
MCRHGAVAQARLHPCFSRLPRITCPDARAPARTARGGVRASLEPFHLIVKRNTDDGLRPWRDFALDTVSIGSVDDIVSIDKASSALTTAPETLTATTKHTERTMTVRISIALAFVLAALALGAANPTLAEDRPCPKAQCV